MATNFFDHEIKSRSSGKGGKDGTLWSSVSSAAYRAGEKLYDERLKKSFDYTDKKTGVLFTEIITPEGAPAWMRDRGKLWNKLEQAADKSTRPKEARVCHSFIVALPNELGSKTDIEKWKVLAREFIHEEFTKKGFIADWAIHAPEKGDKRNFHIHIAVPLRQAIQTERGTWWFGKQERIGKGQLGKWTTGKRQTWACAANKWLEHYGHHERVVEPSVVGRRPKYRNSSAYFAVRSLHRPNNHVRWDRMFPNRIIRPYFKHVAANTYRCLPAPNKTGPNLPMNNASLSGMCEAQRIDFKAACEGKITWVEYHRKWGNPNALLMV